MVHLIQNIRKVECIEAYHLQHSDIIADRGVWLNVYQQFSPISTIGLSSVEISDKIENKQRIFTTKLTMFRSKKLLPGAKKLCFKVTTVTGSQFLIGSSEKPYPVIQNEETFPSEASGRGRCYRHSNPDLPYSDACHIRLESFYAIYIRYNIA